MTKANSTVPPKTHELVIFCDDFHGFGGKVRASHDIYMYIYRFFTWGSLVSGVGILSFGEHGVCLPGALQAVLGNTGNHVPGKNPSYSNSDK